MVTVSTVTLLETCAVSLPYYAKHLGIGECGFWGINAANDTGTCKSIWTLDNRSMLAYYLCQAQDEIENLLKYPLMPTWFTDEPHRIMPGKRYLTDWKKVISGGVMGVEDIALAEAIDDAADPNVIGPVATTVTDPDEIRIYHTGTDQEIIPSKIEIAGGFVTIEIPLCRLVLPEYFANPAVGWNTGDLVFATDADVKRVYNDESTQAKLIKSHCCSTTCISNQCVDQTDDGCIRVIDSETGVIHVTAATYAAGAWSSVVSCGCHERIKLNYYAGLNQLTNDLVDAIIRLAHSRMPHAPCGCDPIKRFWENDRTIPEVLSAERERCLFGLSNGAWEAWRIINNPGLRIFRAGVL